MRKIILGLAVSLDGLIEGPHGEYDWCFTDQDYGMTEFLQRIDAILYGRKSYEMMKAAGGSGGENPFGRKENYIVSRTLKSVDAGYRLISDIEGVRQMKNAGGKDIWLFGGASLTTSFLNAKLVDELWLSVHPIILGRGKPLFSDLPARVRLKLLESRSYDTGLVSLKYEPVYEDVGKNA